MSLHIAFSMAGISPIRRKTQNNPLINQSVNQSL